MPMIRAMRLLNAVEAGTTTGAQLQTLLAADPGRLAEWNVLLGMRGQTRRIAASSTAMAAVIASSTAMAAVAASSTAMAAVAASSTAMAAVAASSTAMAAVIASSTAMAAVAASSTAMAAVAASSTAMAAVIASSTAMSAVAASPTAMSAVIASPIARNAVYNSDAALNAISASSTAIAALASSAQYQTKIGINCTSAAQAIGFTSPAIIIKLSQSWGNDQAYNIVIENLRAGTSISGTKNNGAAPSGTYNATANVPGNTWVLPAQASATQRNTYGSLGAVLNIGFIYV